MQEQIFSNYGQDFWRIYFEIESDKPVTKDQWFEISETITKMIIDFSSENNNCYESTI
jgi:hypothetical protein